MRSQFLAVVFCFAFAAAAQAGECQEDKCKVRILRKIRVPVICEVKPVECSVEERTFRTPIRNLLFGRLICKVPCHVESSDTE